MASKAERDARLDALAKATTDWAARRREYLKNQVAFAKRVLKGRTGSERLAQATVTATTNLVVDEIDQFLRG